jgi:hypothetical protein
MFFRCDPAHEINFDTDNNIVFIGDEQDTTFLPISGFLADSSQSVLRDKIVYLAKVGDSFFLSEVQRIQNAGGIAVLYGSTSGNSYFEIVRLNRSWIRQKTKLFWISKINLGK